MPPKRDSQFLWLSVSDGNEGPKQSNSSSKRAHVLRQHYRKTRTENVEGHSVADKAPKEASTSSTADLQSLTTTFKLHSHQKRRSTKGRKNLKSMNEAQSNNETSRGLVVSDAMVEYAIRPVSPGYVDPFDSLGLGMDPRLSLYMQYCSCAGHISQLDPGGKSLAYPDLLRYKALSCQTLNSDLTKRTDPSTEAVLFTVATSVAAENSILNIKEAKTHMKGLEKLIELGGGLDSLSHGSLSMIYMSNIKLAQATGDRPRLKITDKFQSEIVNLENLSIFEQTPSTDLQGMGDGFFKQRVSIHFMPKFIDILHGLRGMIIHFEKIRNNPKLSSKWDDDLIAIFEHRLLELPYEEGEGAIIGSGIQECCWRAVLLYNHVRLRECFAFPFIVKVAERLRYAISRNFSKCFDATPDLLLWMLYTGLSASKIHTKHADWFANSLTLVARRLDVFSWNDMKPLLRRFFLAERSLGMGFKNESVWEEAQFLTKLKEIGQKKSDRY
ncbi:hypothetical protein UCRPC4_g02464 [Phaeomoniella chlamydospora]|uniref:Tachykinin family protein n=1 Tax=Phaeomoniella chlamydospora TaxID=158046 RepID=A0A0G2EQ06_PHACM|nr:hypothetical protein UCRPC4_g02464 [Phaeomoniella chlamydospora]